MGGKEGGGGGGGIWGSLIEGIFGSVEQSQQLQSQKEAADTAAFFMPGRYTSQQKQDLIVFFALVFVLALVLFFFRKK